MIIIIAYFGYFAKNDNKEKLIVKIPSEKIGDKAIYDVISTINTKGSEAIDTPWGAIKSLDISFKGPLNIQTNGTAEKEDGFGEKHNVIDRYIHQKLVVEGTSEIEPINLGFVVTLHPEGNIKTQDTSYTELKKNTTIQRKIINEIDIDANAENIGNYSVGKIYLKDKIRFYTPPKEYISFASDYLDILSKVMPENRTIKEGDSYSSSNGNNTYKWKAEGVDTIYNKKALRINVTVENYFTNSEFSSIQVIIWVADGISMPVKFLIKGDVDFSLFLKATVEFKYEATLKDYERGKEEIPYGENDGDLNIQKRPGYDNEFIDSDDWNYLPLLGNMDTSLQKNFTGDNASVFAYDNSTGESLEDYIKDHESRNPFIVHAYYNETANKTWNLTFGYKNKKQQDIYIDGFNVLVSKTTNNTKAFGKKEDSQIQPVIEKNDIVESLTFSAVEDIFKNDQEIKKKTFVNNKIDFNNVNFGINVNDIPTPSIGGINIDALKSIELLGGYNFYLEKNFDSGDNLDIFRTAIDGQNGQLLYVVEHHQIISYGNPFS